ncbi:MAG TPA: matrixin family metalloprotease [Candidatus Acidoferrales bacterium]|nr:matrixin family metalloprotease [Candidatus Acidoferrales bacterium]
MKANRRRKIRTGTTIAAAGLFLLHFTAASSGAYDLGTIVGDMRQPASQSGGTSCPQLTRFDISTPGSINRQWSTSLGTSPVTILTADQTPAGQLNEIETLIQQSLSIWTSVAGSSLKPASLAALQRTSTASACTPTDGINSICFNQDDAGFAIGVLAFTRVVSADIAGEQISASAAPSAFVGQILDADVLLRPGDVNTTFATPAALPSNPNAYDLESILTHELGHSFGFNHSGAWRAMMFPFAPPPGQITGTRPTAQSPDAPLSDDDRTGLRVLYPDATDSVHIGSISGRILPANPLVLPISPQGVTGMFPAQIVALDSATGTIAAAAMAGWSCSNPGPPQFDGSYFLQRLAVGSTQTYEIYAEPLDGPVVLGNVIYNLTSLCRNPSTDPGWPGQFACTVPLQAEPFSARIRPGP